MRARRRRLHRSLDADSEDEEGKFYVWTEAEIDALLGTEAGLFKRIYDVTRRRQLGRPHHPQPPRRTGAGSTTRPRPSSPRCRAIAAGGARGPGAPGLRRQGAGRLERADDRGAGRGRAGVRPAGLDRARRRATFDFVIDRQMTGRRPAAPHLARRRARHPATLDDYANMGRAALALHEATGDARLSRRRPSAGSACSTGITGTMPRRRLFLHGRRHGGPDRPHQDAQRQCRAVGQRLDGRGLGPPLAP